MTQHQLQLKSMAGNPIYSGQYTGQYPSASVFVIELVRNGRVVRQVPTGENINATLQSHVLAAFGQVVTIQLSAYMRIGDARILKAMAKIKGFGGRHLVGYVARKGKAHIHLSPDAFHAQYRHNDNPASSTACPGNHTELEKCQMMADTLNKQTGYRQPLLMPYGSDKPLPEICHQHTTAVTGHWGQ